MERQNSFSPSSQLKASLKFTHTLRTDPVKSGAIFRQEAQSGDGDHQLQTYLHQTADTSRKGEEFRGGFEQRVQQTGNLGLEANPAAVKNSEAPILTASGLERNQALIVQDTIPQHDSSQIIRPSPYGRFVPQPSPTPFGVAAWASSVGQQISDNFDALVRQSPAPRVLREHAQGPPHFHTPPVPQHEGLAGPLRSGGADSFRLMPPPRQSPRHALKPEVQCQATPAQLERGLSPVSHMFGGEGGAHSSEDQGLRSNLRADQAANPASSQTFLSPPKAPAEVTITDWYLIAQSSHNSSQAGGPALGLGGTLQGNGMGGVAWMGGPVVERIDRLQVKVSNGEIVNLVGKLHISRTAGQGFGEAVVREFVDGFPATWRELIRRDQESAPSARTESGRANEVTEALAAVPSPATGSEMRDPSLTWPINQGEIGAGSKSQGGSGSKALVEEGPLSSDFGQQAKRAEPKRSASPVTPGESPVLNPGFQTPVSLQPGSVLRRHSEQKKGTASESRGRASGASDRDSFLTPDDASAGAPPFTRLRLKAAQSPANTPPQARAENSPPSYENQVTPVQESKLPESTGRDIRGSSGRQQARGLSAFLEDEGDEADPTFSLEFPPLEDERPGPVAGETLGGGLMPELPAKEGVVEEDNAEAEAGLMKEVGRENGNDDEGKEDSERTESDRPNRGSLKGAADETGEVNSAGAVLPSTSRKSGKGSKGVGNSAGKNPGGLSGRHVGLLEEGSAQRLDSVRRSSRGVQASLRASPIRVNPKGTGTAAPEPSPKGPLLGSRQKPPKGVTSAETATPKPPQQRQGADKTPRMESLAVNPGSADRAERLAKRRKLSGGKVEVTGEKEAEHGGSGGASVEGDEKKAQEGATSADVVVKEEGDAKRMSEARKRSRMLRELESRLKGPADDVIVTRAVKLPEDAQVSRRGRLVSPKLAFWENEYYDRDRAGRIIGISRPPEHSTPSKKLQSPKPFSPKREPIVKLEDAELTADRAQGKQKPGARKEATPIKQEIEAEGDVSTPQSLGPKQKGGGGRLVRLGSGLVAKQQAMEGGSKSPGGSSSPGRWVSTRGKRKRMEEEAAKKKERKTGERKSDRSGSGREESRPSKKRKGSGVSAATASADGPKPSGSASGPKPSGSASGPQPSDSAGRRKSSDQLWRLKRRHGVQKGPRAANFVGDGFVAGSWGEESGRDVEQVDEVAAEGSGAKQGNEGGGNEEEIGVWAEGGSEKKKIGAAGSNVVRGFDRRLRSAGAELARGKSSASGERKEESQKRPRRGEGPVAGPGAGIQPAKRRNGKLQGPVEDLRRRKKERRMDELLLGEKSGTAEDGSVETKRKELKKRSEVKSGSSKSETAANEGGGKATKSAEGRDADGGTPLKGDDVSEKGAVKEGDVIGGEEALGPKEARYPKRRLRKKGDLVGGASVDNGAKTEGTEEKGGLRDGANPAEVVGALSIDQNAATGFGDPAKEGAKPSDGADVEGKGEEGIDSAEGRKGEAAGLNAPQEDAGVELAGEAASLLGAGSDAKEALVEEENAPGKSDLGAEEAAEQLGMGTAENTVASASATDGAPSPGEKNGGKAPPVPVLGGERAGSEAEQKAGGPGSSVAEAQQGHVSEGQQGYVAEVGVGHEGVGLVGLVHPAEAGVGGVSSKGPVPTESEGPVHTSSAEALLLGKVPTETPRPASAKSTEPISTSDAGGVELVHTGGMEPVHTAPADKSVDATEWSESQVAALKTALRLIDPTVDGLWYKVARQVPGKNHIECQTKHNEAYATPPVRPPHARRAGMSPPPRIIVQGAGKGLARAANPSKPRGTIVSVQMQGMRAAREILRAQQAKQRAEAGDPLAFHVAASDGTGLKDPGTAADGGSTPVASPLILKPVQNQDKYIDDALQRRLQAQRRKNAASQGGFGAQTLKVAAPVLGFEGVARETVVGGAAGVVAAAEKARALREQPATSMEDERDGLAGGEEEEDADEDDPPPFA